MNTKDGHWWTKPWNPIKVKGGGWHCTKCSPGCKNCWAEGMNIRFGNGEDFNGVNHQTEYFPGFEIDRHILESPIHWKKPQVIAFQWLGDPLHELISPSLLDECLEVIRKAKQHIVLMLTKRPQNFSGSDIKNLWHGVSICTQKEADEKIPILLQIPAAHRFVNLGPMLENISLKFTGCPNCGQSKQCWFPNYTICKACGKEVKSPPDSLDWVTLECESGPGRRPMKLEWARSIAEQCESAGVPLFIKQLPIASRVSHDPTEWPEYLRIRQWPFSLENWIN